MLTKQGNSTQVCRSFQLFPDTGIGVSPERATEVKENAANNTSFESLHWLFQQTSSFSSYTLLANQKNTRRCPHPGRSKPPRPQHKPFINRSPPPPQRPPKP